MRSATRILLLSAMLFTATLAFVPAPAVACSSNDPVGCVDGAPCAFGNDCPVPCWKDGNECPPRDLIEDAPCVSGNPCPVPCTAGGPCPVPCVQSNPCPDVPCIQGNDCPTDDLCFNVNCIDETCGSPCNIAQNQPIWVEDWSVNTSGGIGASVTRCRADGSGCVTTGFYQAIPDSLCFAYNPNALTNACLTPSSLTKYVPVPNVGTSPETVCIIGDQCVDVPVPGVGTTPTPVTVPTYEGYVEVTAACGYDVPCRVTL